MQEVCRGKGAWEDLSRHTVQQAAFLLNSQRLHFILDVQGWSGAHALALLRLRPAPIQVSYKNFVGSLGATRDVVPWLIADRIVAPVEYSAFYSESLVYLPGTYYGAGHHTFDPHNTPPPPPPPSSSGAAGCVDDLLTRSQGYVPSDVPADGLVLGAFSNLGKVNSQVWFLWCRILKSNANTALWIIAEPGFGVPSLIQHAIEQGVKRTQLIFTERIHRPDHMRVKRRAAIYLDTWPFNGHSTSVEALWEALPVLTLPGVRLAGRVGASVVRAAGQAHRTVARNEQDYFDITRAVTSSQRGIMWVCNVRQELMRKRTSSILFDVPRWINAFGNSLRCLWDVHVHIHTHFPHLVVL
jgi:predicted O-linked N-acetylglucosamine transferase (SPINDLY family)